MIIPLHYAAPSGFVAGVDKARVALATNTLREATFFDGASKRPLLLRDGLAALYAVVTSDLRYVPRDRLAFAAWLAEQDRRFLQTLPLQSQAIREQLDQKQAQLAELDVAQSQRLAPFRAARLAYINYAVEHQYELDYVLDPIITVHPDEVSFEAFSRDESSYGRFAAGYDAFSEVNQLECGTTNVDFSAQLHQQLERLRSYRDTRLTVQPSGFTVQHASSASYKEKKIELPDSWLMGFLQVHSVMTLGLTQLSLAPVDLYNICRVLRRFRAKTSPRALRWQLTPGKATRVFVEPWDKLVELSPVSRYHGEKPQTIRTWGRDRLRVIERLLAITTSVDVYLAGHGLPSVYVCDLGGASFTLALSGWTDQDWSGDARFELLSRRLDVDATALAGAYQVLRARRRASAEQIAADLQLGVEASRSALSFLCQTGRAMFDLGCQAYRHRDLLWHPFDAQTELVKAKTLAEESNPRAKAARAIFEADAVRFTARRPVGGGYKLSGSAKGADGERVRPVLSVNGLGEIMEATCTCKFFRKYRLTRGPCEHVLALRLAHMARLEADDNA